MRGEALAPAGVSTVSACLAWGSRELGEHPDARLEAEILLGHVLGGGRERVYARGGEPLGAAPVARYAAFVRERAATRIPVAYLTGVKEFMGLEFAVRRGVFIPRPETEGLVDIVEGWWRERFASPEPVEGRPEGVIVDACCGSGAVGVALALRLGADVIATDVSPDAIDVTRVNAARLGVSERVRPLLGSLLEPLESLEAAPRIAAVVSNPPYVPRDAWNALAPDIRDFEPRSALDGGGDGLEIVRQLVARARDALPPGGLLAMEIGGEQGGATLSLLAGPDWEHPRIHADMAGLPRIAVATRTPCGGPDGLIGFGHGPRVAFR